MAHITNQWLKGSVSKERGHFPVPVDMTVEWEADERLRKAGWAVRLHLRKIGGEDFHVLTLSVKEIQAIVDTLLQECDPSGK